MRRSWRRAAHTSRHSRLMGMEIMGLLNGLNGRRAGILGVVAVLAMIAPAAAQASGAITAAAGVPFSGVVDSASCTPTSPTPSINWGDGSAPSSGTYDPTSGDVTGSHTYAATGSYTGAVALDCATTPDSFTATVKPAPLFKQCPPVDADSG